MIKNIVKSAGIFSLYLGAASVVSGGAVALLMGRFDFFPFSLCLLFVLLLQTGANLYHRYKYMQRHGDCATEHYMQWTDPVTADETAIMREATMAIWLLAAMTGMGLVSLGDIRILAVGILTAAAIYFNDNGPRPLSETPVKYFITLLFFGPVAVVSIYIIEVVPEVVDPLTWRDLMPAVLMGTVIGIRISNSELLYNYMCHDCDKSNGRNTIAVALGKRGASALFMITTVAAFVIVVVASATFRIGVWYLPIIISGLETAVFLYIGAKMQHLDNEKFYPFQLMMNRIVFVVSILYFIIFAICGSPESISDYCF